MSTWPPGHVDADIKKTNERLKELGLSPLTHDERFLAAAVSITEFSRFCNQFLTLTLAYITLSVTVVVTNDKAISDLASQIYLLIGGLGGVAWTYFQTMHATPGTILQKIIERRMDHDTLQDNTTTT